MLLSLSLGKGKEWNPAEKIATEITAPIQRLFTWTISFSEDIWSNYFYLVKTHRENQMLKKKIKFLEIENSKYQEVLLANRRLSKLLGLKENTDWPLLPSRVIGWDSSGLFNSIIIDKGESDGIEIDMPIINAEGVVGRVISVSPSYARVLLITDPNSAVDGLVQRTRGRGMIRGRGTNQCFFDYAIRTCDIEKDDLVVTSGVGGVFPKGINLGYVEKIEGYPNKLFKAIKVNPSVDFSRLEEVFVVIKSNHGPLCSETAQ